MAAFRFECWMQASQWKSLPDPFLAAQPPPLLPPRGEDARRSFPAVFTTPYALPSRGGECSLLAKKRGETHFESAIIIQPNLRGLTKGLYLKTLRL